MHQTFRIVSVTLPILTAAALFETLISIVGVTGSRVLTNSVNMATLVGTSTVPIIFELLIVSSTYYAFVVKVVSRDLERVLSNVFLYSLQSFY